MMPGTIDRGRAWRTRVAAGAAVALLAAAPAYAVSRYRAVPLGDLGGGYARTFGINGQGHVVGGSHVVAYTTYRAYVHDGTRMIALGTLGGRDSAAHAISDAGAVTGWAMNAMERSRTFLHAAGVMTDITARSGEFCGSGDAINEAGQVAGSIDYACEANIQATLYSGGTALELQQLGYWSSAQGINERGDVTGWSYFAGLAGHQAFLWSRGTLRALGTLGGDYSRGAAINDAGTIVGWSSMLPQANFPRHAFVMAGDRMVDLGTLGGSFSEALAIDNQGRIVGTAATTGDLGMRAFLHQEGRMHDLNDLLVAPVSGAPLTEARGINERGQIAANSCPSTVNGIVCRAFRLDPVADDAATEVPALSQWALVAAALVLTLAAWTRLRQR